MFSEACSELGAQCYWIHVKADGSRMCAVTRATHRCTAAVLGCSYLLLAVLVTALCGAATALEVT